MKKAFLLMALAGMCLLAGCGSKEKETAAAPDVGDQTAQGQSQTTTAQAAGDDSKVYEWVIGTHHPETTPAAIAIKDFIEDVDKETGGKVKITFSTGGALGSQREIIEGVNLGTIDIGYGETGVYSNYNEDLGTLILPFLFDSTEQFYAAMDGKAGAYYDELLQGSTNMKIFVWMNGGTRDVYSSKPLDSYEDLKGLKIRTPESNVYVSLFKALGANPTAIAATEMYSSIQQGVVEAMEGAVDTAINYKIYEVADNCLRTSHIFCDCGLVINKDSWNSLPPELQEIVGACADRLETNQRKLFEELSAEYSSQLVDLGMKFEDGDPEYARAAVKPFVDDFIGQTESRKKLYDLIQEDIASVK